jgi:hypothetical protein
MWTGELDLLTACTHHTELQVITALSLISTSPSETFYSLLCLQQPFPSNDFYQWKFYSFPRSHRYCPANIPQLNSLTQQPTTSHHFTQLNCPAALGSSLYIAPGRTQQTTPSFPRVRVQGYAPSRDLCIATVAHATARKTMISMIRPRFK